MQQGEQRITSVDSADGHKVAHRRVVVLGDVSSDHVVSLERTESVETEDQLKLSQVGFLNPPGSSRRHRSRWPALDPPLPAQQWCHLLCGYLFVSVSMTLFLWPLCRSPTPYT